MFTPFERVHNCGTTLRPNPPATLGVKFPDNWPNIWRGRGEDAVEKLDAFLARGQQIVRLLRVDHIDCINLEDWIGRLER